MSAPKKPIILVDGSSYLYRAFHALPALMNSKGFPTGAIYGMINMLRRLIADYQPEFMAVVFDAKGKTFREELYAEYKAHRQAMPDELSQQISHIHHAIDAMGLPRIMIEGVEADDVIGTLSAYIVKNNQPVLISTSDKDLAQLVNEQVTLVNTMSNTVLDIKGVVEKFGVPPERIIDYLTLIGDTTDNIPGVPLVGPKTAAKWLNQHGDLDTIVLNADKISGKVGENLRATLSQLPLSKSLVTIKMDVQHSLDLKDFAVKPADKAKLIAFFKEMEFKTWLSELLSEAQNESADQYAHYALVQTNEDLERWLDLLIQQDTVALAIETDMGDYMRAKIVGLSFAIAAGEAAYIPLLHRYPGVSVQLDKAFVLHALQPILENPNIQKIIHNLKYCLEIFKNEGISLGGALMDTMMQSYVLDSTSSDHTLDSLALKYLGRRNVAYDDLVGKGSKQIEFQCVAIQKAGIYACEKADVSYRLHQTLWPRIQNEAALKRVYEEIEIPLIGVLATVEQNGVLIDAVKLKIQGEELQRRLDELEKEAFAIADCAFNMNSPKQLQEILFDKLKLPILQKTPTGQPSTADAVLQELALQFTLPRLIIEYRSLSKLISTYTSRLGEQINPLTGRIHTSYNQAATATGRLSSSEPNLQNIPIRTAEGRRIRQAFVAKSGYRIVSADYSQIELRLMAHLSQDPGFLHAFKQNLDIHRATAAEVWDVPLEEVTTEMRRNAKAINFGLIYGMSAFGLTRQLGIERKAAQEYIERYFARYPNVRAYMENACRKARETGFVETLWGRRLYIPDINASQIPRQKAAERIAINAPLQGSAADIIKLAMIQIDEWLQADEINAKMIMQVHDELVFEVSEKDLAAISAQIQTRMASVAELSVPLLVCVGAGEDWDKASNH